jgi:hypothetical protein
MTYYYHGLLDVMARLTAKITSATSGGNTARRPPKMPRIARTLQRLGRMIPEEELHRIPKDLSSRVDHYVYATPKR